MTIKELTVKFNADFKGFHSGVNQLNKSVTDSSKHISSAFTGIQSVISKAAIGIAAVGAGAIYAGKQAIDAYANFDSLKRGLTSIAGSSAEAEKQLVRLKEVAKLPGLGFREAVQGSINLQAAGMSAKLAEEALKGFGNALATVGKGKAELEGVITALSQIMSKGKVSAEEINQIAERVPQIRQIMKSAFGTADTEAIQKMGISSEQFVAKITTELGKLPVVTGGIKNSFENMQDAINTALVKIGESIAPIVTLVSDVITNNVANWGAVIAQVLGNMVTWIAVNMNSIKLWGSYVWDTVKNVTKGFIDLMATLFGLNTQTTTTGQSFVDMAKQVNDASKSFADNAKAIGSRILWVVECVKGGISVFRILVVALQSVISTSVLALMALDKLAKRDFSGAKSVWQDMGKYIDEDKKKIEELWKEAIKPLPKIEPWANDKAAPNTPVTYSSAGIPDIPYTPKAAPGASAAANAGGGDQVQIQILSELKTLNRRFEPRLA